MHVSPVTILGRLHHDLLDRVRQLSQLPPDQRHDAARELRAWFQVHCLLEETIFYPATLDLRSDEVVEAELDDLDQQKRLLAELCDLPELPAPGRSFEVILADLSRRLERHVNDEERDFYPRVERLLDADQREDLALQLGTLVERARRHFAGEELPPGEPTVEVDDLDRLLVEEELLPSPAG
jgi:hypothetical protein